MLSKLLLLVLATSWMGAVNAADCKAPKPAADMSIEDYLFSMSVYARS